MQHIGQNWKTNYGPNNIKMENNEFQKVCIKNCTFCCFDDSIQFEHFDLVNPLIDEKSLSFTIGLAIL